MFLFPMPSAIERKINTLSQFWEGKSEKTKMHLVKWQVVMRNKEARGLGVRKLKLHNKRIL